MVKKAVIINGSNKKSSRLTGIHEYVENYLTKGNIQTNSIFVMNCRRKI